MEIFIHTINEKTIMLETDADVSVNDIIKSFMNECNDIDKTMEERRFSFF